MTELSATSAWPPTRSATPSAAASRTQGRSRACKSVNAETCARSPEASRSRGGRAPVARSFRHATGSRRCAGIRAEPGFARNPGVRPRRLTLRARSSRERHVMLGTADSHRRRDERLAEPTGDTTGKLAPVLRVREERQVRTVLLHGTAGEDDGRSPRVERRTNLLATSSARARASRRSPCFSLKDESEVTSPMQAIKPRAAHETSRIRHQRSLVRRCHCRQLIAGAATAGTAALLRRQSSRPARRRRRRTARSTPISSNVKVFGAIYSAESCSYDPTAASSSCRTAASRRTCRRTTRGCRSSTTTGRCTPRDGSACRTRPSART